MNDKGLALRLNHRGIWHAIRYWVRATRVEDAHNHVRLTGSPQRADGDTDEHNIAGAAYRCFTGHHDGRYRGNGEVAICEAIQYIAAVDRMIEASAIGESIADQRGASRTILVSVEPDFDAELGTARADASAWDRKRRKRVSLKKSQRDPDVRISATWRAGSVGCDR